MVNLIYNTLGITDAFFFWEDPKPLPTLRKITIFDEFLKVVNKRCSKSTDTSCITYFRYGNYSNKISQPILYLQWDNVLG